MKTPSQDELNGEVDTPQEETPAEQEKEPKRAYVKPYLRPKDESQEGDLWCD